MAAPANDDRNDRERAKAIELAVGQIEKQFGKGSIMRLGGNDVIPQMPSISTGSVSLDYALGIGGVPRGRVIEVFGPESSGKTTLALQIIAQAQKVGGMAAFVDAEHALDAQYAPQAGRRAREPARLAARQRRTGARDRRSARPLRRRRRHRRRLGRGPRAARRNRRRDGRSADGPAGPPHVAGAPQADRHRLEVEDVPHLHQPAPREDRRHVRQPGNDHRRPRAEVLLVGPHRHPPHRRHQGRRRRRRRAHPREDRQEQGRAAVPRGGVRRDVRRGDLEGRRPARPGGRSQDRREERHLVRLRAASGSARAARTSSSS